MCSRLGFLDDLSIRVRYLLIYFRKDIFYYENEEIRSELLTTSRMCKKINMIFCICPMEQ